MDNTRFINVGDQIISVPHIRGVWFGRESITKTEEGIAVDSIDPHWICFNFGRENYQFVKFQDLDSFENAKLKLQSELEDITYE